MSCANERITSNRSNSRPNTTYSSTPASNSARRPSPRSAISRLTCRSSSRDSGLVGRQGMAKRVGGWLPLKDTALPLLSGNALAGFTGLNLDLARPHLLRHRNLDVQDTVLQPAS